VSDYFGYITLFAAGAIATCTGFWQSTDGRSPEEQRAHARRTLWLRITGPLTMAAAALLALSRYMFPDL